MSSGPRNTEPRPEFTVGNESQVRSAPHSWVLQQSNSSLYPKPNSEIGSRNRAEVRQDMPLTQYPNCTTPQTQMPTSELHTMDRNTQPLSDQANVGTPSKESTTTTRSRYDPPVISDAMSMEDRIAYLLKCANDVGFDSFDAAVTAYYTTSLSESSISRKSQKISRNRRLPGVLVDLRASAKTWTRWEARGYEEEVVRSAESVFIQELDQFAVEQTDSRGIPDERSIRIISPDASAKRLAATSEMCRIFRRREQSKSKFHPACMTPPTLDRPNHQKQPLHGTSQEGPSTPSREQESNPSSGMVAEILETKIMLEDEVRCFL